MEDIQNLQDDKGWKKSTLYSAKEELKIKSVKIGFNNKKTWWLLPYIDEETFKQHTQNGIPSYENTNIFKDDGYSIIDDVF